MCLFETLADITSLEKCTASVATDATVADIVPMLHGRFFVGLDSGTCRIIVHLVPLNRYLLALVAHSEMLRFIVGNRLAPMRCDKLNKSPFSFLAKAC